MCDVTCEIVDHDHDTEMYRVPEGTWVVLQPRADDDGGDEFWCYRLVRFAATDDPILCNDDGSTFSFKEADAEFRRDGLPGLEWSIYFGSSEPTYEDIHGWEFALGSTTND